MFKQNRILLAGALALSMLVMGGCTMQPGSLLNLDKVTGASAQAKSTLKVTISQGLKTQAIAGAAIELRLELPYAQDPEKRYQTVSVQNGETATFADLPPENGSLTAVLTNIETNEIIDRQTQNVSLKPGFETRVNFVFVQGGSAAVDVGVRVETSRFDYRYKEFNDGLDSDYRQSWPSYWDKQFELTTETGTYSVRFGDVWNDQTKRRIITRQIGMEPWENLGIDYDNWFYIPDHAVLLGSDVPLGDFPKVRHFQWRNLFTVDGVESERTIDRWYSPTEGLLKETVQAGETIVTTLARSGV